MYALPAGQGRASTALVLFPVSVIKYGGKHLFQAKSPRGNRSGNVTQLVTPCSQSGAEREGRSSVCVSPLLACSSLSQGPSQIQGGSSGFN